MRYSITNNNLHIFDSYATPKAMFRRELEFARRAHYKSDVWKRSINSMRREWATHNLCYAIGYKRERTKDVDLNYPQKWYVKLAYAVIGTLALIVIK